VDEDKVVGHTRTAGWTKCSICDRPAWIRKSFKYHDLCSHCVKEITREQRWARWDANPDLIQRYPNVYELLEYFQSRCPLLAAELLAVDNDAHYVNPVDYRGEHDEE
jgi:hypothetical protein